MSRIEFDAVSDRARVWIFGAAAPLDGPQASRVRETIDAFLGGWTSHEQDFPSAATLLHDRFLIVAAEDEAVAGGCAVDRLFRTVRALRADPGVDFLDTTRIWWREGDAIRSASRAEFRALAERGAVGEETMVFDTTADRIGSIRSGGWERRAGASWHAGAFPLRRAS